MTAEEAGLPDVARLATREMGAGSADVYRAVWAAVDRVVIPLVLRACGGNQVAAARRLGISRTTLRARLAELKLAADAA